MSDIQKYRDILQEINGCFGTVMSNEFYDKRRIYNNKPIYYKLLGGLKQIHEEAIEEIIRKAVALCEIAREKGFY